MIYEHRTYTVAHGLMDEYLLRYETHALPLQQKHLGRLVGFFITDIGPLNQVILIWAYDSLAQREQCRAAMEAALHRIVASEGLSKNVLEIATKSLA